MDPYILYIQNTHVARNNWLTQLRPKKHEESNVKPKFHTINELQRAIRNESSLVVFNYISEHLDLSKYFQHILFSSATRSYVKNLDFNNIRAIINFKEINKIKHINEHFNSVNKLLPDAGIYIGRAETYWERKKKFLRVFGNRLGTAVWLTDFVVNRVLPRLRGIEKIYSFFTGGNMHVISQAELLGRLVYSGFNIIEYRIIHGKLYFVVIKTGEPKTDPHPSYHPIIRLNRVGKNGKMIGVYKVRTMHPYSEYLQDYILKLNGYNAVGKPAKDFRVARWGKFMRKYWIDEWPQVLNVLRGEMKLVGVRPISKVRFSQFPKDLQEERIKYKPGCFPPYVALNMPDDEGNIEAERIYLKDKKLRPYTNDIRYFFKSVWNILTLRLSSS